MPDFREVRFDNPPPVELTRSKWSHVINCHDDEGAQYIGVSFIMAPSGRKSETFSLTPTDAKDFANLILEAVKEATP